MAAVCHNTDNEDNAKRSCFREKRKSKTEKFCGKHIVACINLLWRQQTGDIHPGHPDSTDSMMIAEIEMRVKCHEALVVFYLLL